ncbi:MAG: GNAT family N-acetyltransferase, partial [Ktedonobacteraceae bacterium]
MQIINLHPDDEYAIEQAARLLVEGFSPPAWTDMEAALEEVRVSFKAGHISRVALDEQGNVLGWIGGVSEYDGNVWEMHPLVIDARSHGQGIGRWLVQDFEQQVQARGGVTIMLGTDDE